MGTAIERARFLPSPVQAIQRIERAREALSEELTPLDPWGVLRKLALGQSTSGTPDAVLRILGFVHILSASGIHLLALYALVTRATLFLMELCGAPLALALGVSRLASFIIWLWAWILRGCTPGMLRPWVLITTRSCADQLGLRLQPWTPIILLLTLNWAYNFSHAGKLHDLSSLYYSLAVGGGYLGASIYKKARSKPFGVALAMATGAWVFLAILELYSTHLVSIYCPILSLATAPLFCALLYPWLVLKGLCLFLNFETGNMSEHFFKASIELSNSWLQWLAKVAIRTHGLWVVIDPEKPLIAFAFLAAFICLLLRPAQKRILLRLLALAILTKSFLNLSRGTENSVNSAAPVQTPEASEIIQLDVGQGDAAVVILADGSTGLIDTGSQRALNEAQWLETLARLNIKQLDFVGLTHLDEDHRGSLQILSQLIKIRCIATSEQELNTPRGAIFQATMAERGIVLQSWKQGCVKLDVLEPKKTLQSARSNNSRMSALLIHTQDHAYYLIGGDAEGDDEIRIAQWAHEKIMEGNYRNDLRILKISHHGSKTSSSKEVLSAYQPQLAIISSGVGNPYGHPHTEVLRRLEEEKIPIYRIDRKGAFRGEAFRRPRP